MHRLPLGIGILSLSAALSIDAQQKPAATPADYGQWERLVTHARATTTGPLSPDGRWLVYGINRTNGQHELRVTSVGDGTVVAQPFRPVEVASGATKSAPFGEQPAFSADSRWLAYAIGFSEAEEQKLRKEKKPLHKKLGLLNLSTGDTKTFDGIESFAFDASGAHLAMRQYPPEPAERREGDTGSGAGADERDPAGATLLVLDVAKNTTISFGNVVEYAWQTSRPQGPGLGPQHGILSRGGLLALTIGAQGNAANGVQLYDPAGGTIRVLDSSPATYSGLAWRKDEDDLAVLRSKSDDRHEGPTHVALSWIDLTTPSPQPSPPQGGGEGARSAGEGDKKGSTRTYDPTADPQFPTGMKTVSWRKPAWSDDGRIVFLGLAAWDEKPADTQRSADAASKTATASKDDEDEEPAGVEVWHARDANVMPRQKVNARNDRRRSHLAAWHLETGRLVQLAKSFDEEVRPLGGTPFAYLVDRAPYAMDRSFGRLSADLYLVDLDTGDRRKVKDRADDRPLQASPGGQFLLFLEADHYWTYNIATGVTTNITKAAPTSFVDRKSDAIGRQKPPFGVAGWTKDEGSVVLHDEFDLWDVKPDGSRATRLTDGAAEQIRHRYARLDADEESIDPERPLYVRLHGIWSKKSGYARVRLDGQSSYERLVWLDKQVDRLARAKDADKYAYVMQAFDDSPDYLVGESALAGAKAVTQTNAFQNRYAWGQSELIEYKSDRGERLQGALFYPANYEPGRRYPMVLLVYEKRSDLLHQYSSLSDREPYNAAVFTSLGYFFLQPDIVFRPREPGLSAAECVVPAVRKVIQMGLVDPGRVGIMGHSWGGFDTTFLTTHTDTFAAGVAGAPITDLVSNYGNHHWSSGIAETDHIETGQQRMEVPLWEDLQAYVRNSAVFAAHQMKTPLLIGFGDNDGTVHWHQGVELYNVARRAGKPVVMLVYAGEDHGLRKKANQQDYHRRIVEWFGHYLQGQPAPAWIERGVSYLDRERELKVKKPAPKKPTTSP